MRPYRGDTAYPDLKNRDITIVDDGIAASATMKATLTSVHKKGAKFVVIATPVAPPSTIGELERIADRVICLSTPEPFYAIGQFYRDIAQTSDEEVINLLKLNRQELGLT